MIHNNSSNQLSKKLIGIFFIYVLANFHLINFVEKKGSAQIKTCIIFSAINTQGITKIKAKKSRNHTELLLKYLKLPIKVKERKNFDLIEIKKVNKIKPIIYQVPSDISSGAYFIALTAPSKNTQIIIKYGMKNRNIYQRRPF